MKQPCVVKLKEVAEFVGGSTPPREHAEYFGGGIPWVKTTDLTNGEITKTEETLSKSGLKKSACKMIPAEAVLVAMYGGFRQIGRTGLLSEPAAINQALTAIIPDKRLMPRFLLAWLNYRAGYWKRFAGSSRKDPNITKNDVADFPVALFELSYQKSVIALISEWESAIESTSKLVLALEKRKQGLMQQLLTGRRRLKGFKESWKLKRIGDFAITSSVKNKSVEDLPVLSCTKHAGLVDSLSYFGRQMFSESTATYKLVKRGQFAYATNHIEEGSIGYQDQYDAALISPMYTVFETDGTMVNDLFLYKVLKSEQMRREFESATSASVARRGSLRWPAFAKLKISLPPLNEQIAISKVLDEQDEQLRLANEQLTQLKAQKRALMQKLLSGQWRMPAKAMKGKKS